MLEQLSTSPTHVLSADTQVVLLLCGRLGQSHATDAKPLTQGEYDRLVQWLVQHDMRPADLLDSSRLGLLQDAGTSLPVSFSRVSLLLDRSGALALAVEGWANKGLWVVSRSDPGYPSRFRVGRLGPPLLYGAGKLELLSQGGLAIVGSRDIDDDALDFTRRVARACARQGIQVVSGGARGVDIEAMLAALSEGGTAVGVLADSLLRSTLSGKYRVALTEGVLALISPYDPGAGFDVGSAMGRNKHVYGLSDYALIVSSSFEKGGTWAGAIEALKARKIPIYVRVEGNAPRGNQELLKLGAQPFPERPWTDLARRLLERQDSANGHLAEIGLPATEGPSHMPAVDPMGIDDQDYEAALPQILSYLSEPRDERSLARLLGVTLAVVRPWLKKAVAAGAVDKTAKPVRYTLPAPRLPLE